MAETNFPYEAPKALGERLEDEIAYLVNTYALRSFQRDDEQELQREEIPLDYVANAPRIKCICKDLKLIRYFSHLKRLAAALRNLHAPGHLLTFPLLGNASSCPVRRFLPNTHFL